MVGTIQGERYNVRQKTADKKEKKSKEAIKVYNIFLTGHG